MQGGRRTLISRMVVQWESRDTVSLYTTVLNVSSSCSEMDQLSNMGDTLELYTRVQSARSPVVRDTRPLPTLRTVYTHADHCSGQKLQTIVSHTQFELRYCNGAKDESHALSQELSHCSLQSSHSSHQECSEGCPVVRDTRPLPTHRAVHTDHCSRQNFRLWCPALSSD
ncbi:uncharacterized protein LOC135347650 [Halichondria panicea]|uniref:uncharacterized protein LOC135347650 n=1 Tax=Halichondria panicea TaxID=6063 RepID=UPI00312BA8FD